MPSAPPPTARALAIALTAVGAFIAFLDVTIVNIAFPSIARSFPGTEIAGLSWILNAYNVVFAALLVVAGRLADLIGRRRFYVIGLTLFTIASAGCAAAASPGQLVAARVVQAIGAAIIVPTSLALLLPLFPTRRAAAVALWTATAAVASGIGPSLGGVLIELSGWRAVFLVNVPLGLVAAPLAARFLTESRELGGRMPDLLGSALLAGAVGALALGIVEGQRWGWDGARVLGCFATAIALTLLAARRATRHPSPIVEPALLRLPAFAAANAATLVIAAAFYAAILCNVLFLTSVWHFSVLEAGLAVTPAPLVAVVAAASAERLGARLGARATVAAGALALAAGASWFSLVVGPEAAFLNEWLPGMVLVGMGVGFSFPALGNAALTAVPETRLATASAVNATARQIGAVLGIALLVAVLGDVPGPAAFDAGWRLCAALAGAVGVVAALSGFLLRGAAPVALSEQA